MKKTLKPILFIMTLVTIVSVFVVCAAASDTAFDYTGVACVTEFVDEPGYDDIYYSVTEGYLWWQTTTYGNWVQVSTNSATKAIDESNDGAYNAVGDLHYGSGYKAYYNGESETLVIIGTSASSIPTASYGDNSVAGRFPNWCKQYADRVTTLELRNMAGLNNVGYIIRDLKSVTTIKIDTAVCSMQGTKSDTAAFAGLTALETLGWGTWATDGTWTASSTYYEDGVVDLRGFTTLNPGATTTVLPDQILYMDSAIMNSTSVTKVILPASLTTAADTSIKIVEVSDGTSSFPLYDGSGNVASGKAAYRIKNSTSGAIAYTTSWSAPSGWEYVTVLANDVEPYNGQFAGMIPYQFASGATSLATVIIPSDVTLHRIYSQAFNNCTALKEIYLEGTVSDDFVVDASAFGSGTGNVSGVKIYVNNIKTERIINNALSAAGYTDRSKVMAYCDSLESPIIADGFQVKINTNYNGLRALFTFDENSKATNAERGLNFVEYGVIVCTKAVATQHSTKDGLLESTNAKVKRVAVEKADGTGENRWVDYEKRQFCIALTGIPQSNSMDDIYFLGYSIWEDDAGGVYNLYTEYIASDEEPYANLYEVTMGLFKNGLLNSETVSSAGGDTDAIIWTPLSTGALTVASADFGAGETPKNTSTSVTYTLNVSATYNSDGSFTYLDLPLHATTGANAANYSYNPSAFEATATTNVLWSLYQDGDSYVAVYRRDPAADESAVAFLPTQSIISARAIHPFCDGYGALKTNKVSGDITIYSPVLSTENAKLVKTLVIDYGVDSTEARTSRNGSFALGNAKYTETIVYPNGFTLNTASQSMFRNNINLKNVIWANKPTETEAQKYHMGDVIVSSGTMASLADLRGMGKIHPEATFMESGIENIVFAGYSADSHTQTYGSMGTLNRVWIDDAGVTTAPAPLTIDLSGDTKVTKLGRQSFQVTTEGYTIKLSDSVTTVSQVGSSGSYISAFAVTFCKKAVPVDVVAPNANFAASFYDYYLTFLETEYRTYSNYVKVNGKTYFEIAEDVCFVGENVLEIFPELPENVNRDYAYKVSVHQGSESANLPVYNHTMFNGAGERGVGADIYRRYSTFGFSGDQVRVDIKVGKDFGFYSVIPSAKEFESSFDESTGTISVYLDEPDYFAIRLDDDDNSIISIFAENPEYPHVTNLVDGKGGAIIFESGSWYLPTHGDGITETTSEHTGTLYINTPDTILYIQPGAVVYGRVKLSSNATYSSIVGYGAIIDCFADNRVLDIRQGGTEGGGQYTSTYKSQMVSNSSSYFLYDGPTIMDARCFNIVSSGNFVHVRNYKAMCTMMTSDGITDCTKNQGIFEHCWLYVGDNALVVSAAAGSYYNDIVIGTTCASIFPQGSVRNVLIENISIFRSNDGIVSHRYNPSNSDLACLMTFRNLDCVDVINYPQFFWGHKMGLSTEKVLTFENITLPYSSGVTNPHSNAVNNTWATKNVLVEITQPDGTTCGNYTMNFINTYMDGTLLDSEDKAVFAVTLPEGATMTYNFSTSSNGFTPPTKTENYVNYTATNKVYIGTYPAYFDNDVIVEGSTFYLPATEILAKLRTTVSPTTVTKNGIAYVAHTVLASSGAASAATVTGGNLTITPVAPSATENLILQNSGLVTREYESTCYNIDLVQTDGVMYAYPTTSGYNGGICYNLTEEIRMYGAGTYKLTLKARCEIVDGGAYTPVKLLSNYDTSEAYYTTLYTSYTLTGDWVEYTHEFVITEDMIDTVLTFGGVGIAATGNVPVQYYAVKDIVVNKIG